MQQFTPRRQNEPTPDDTRQTKQSLNHNAESKGKHAYLSVACTDVTIVIRPLTESI